MNKLFVLLSAAIFFCGCTTSEEKRKYDEKRSRTYVIKCEMPGSREVKEYKVDFVNMMSPTNHRGGIWRFETLDGKAVRSTICHVEE